MTNQQVAKEFVDGATMGHSMHMFINGDTIFSYGYHFPMARRTGRILRNGKEVVLFTTRTYSNTTARHLCHTMDALRSNDKFEVVEVHNVEHPEVDEMTQRLDNAISKKARARVEYMRDFWAREANEIHHAREIVATLFV